MKDRVLEWLGSLYKPMHLDREDPPRLRPSLRKPLARGLALFLGGFTGLNLLGNLWRAHFDANLWWIDLRQLPPRLALAVLVLAATCLIAFGLRLPRSKWRQTLTVLCAGGLGTVALVNSLNFYRLWLVGVFHGGIPLPLSLLLAGGLLFIALAAIRPVRTELTPAEPVGRTSGGLLAVFAVCLACAVVFPLAQMFCFGNTDYRRPADVAVVLGARVYRDGRASQALADRVRTACRLYREGWVNQLIMSGGPGDGPIHETESMKRLAIQLGVRPEHIWTDLGGLNTQATVSNTVEICRQIHARRVLVVSHFYHLPRIKLTYQRAGWEVYTVPARQASWLGQLPYNMAREVAALWVYYGRPLLGPRSEVLCQK